MSSNVFVKSGRVIDLLTLQSGTPTGPWMFKDAPKTAIQAVSTTAATIIIEASNDGVNANTTAVGTITLAGAGADGFVTDAPWKFLRARVTVNTGNVNVTGCN